MKMIFTFALAVFMSVCAYASGDGQPLEDRVKQLAEARLSSNWALAYDLADDDYKKDLSKEEFIGLKRGMNHTHYSIEDIRQDDPNEAQAIIIWDFEAGGYAFKGRKEVQKWVREKGEWNYFMPRDTKFGFDG